jgi:hypothetical protein
MIQLKAVARYDQIGVDDLPEKVRSYRSSHVIVAGDDPSELVRMEELERRYIERVMEAVGGKQDRRGPHSRSRSQTALSHARSTWHRIIQECFAHWIRAFIVSHVPALLTLVGGRTGVLRSSLFFRLRRKRAGLESLHGSSSETTQLLAEKLGLPPDEIGRALTDAYGECSGRPATAA